MEIVKAPAKILSTYCKPTLETVTQQVVEKMRYLMHKNKGIGLAAPQVGIDARFFVTENEVYINPQILELGGDKTTMMEGCLSIPGVKLPVDRPNRISVSWKDIDGVVHAEWLEGLIARVFQHEYDHLNGVLFTRRFAERYEV